MSTIFSLVFRPASIVDEHITVQRSEAEAFERAFDMVPGKTIVLTDTNLVLLTLAKAFPDNNAFDQLLTAISERGPQEVRVNRS